MDCLVNITEKIPAFKFSFEHFYLDTSKIETQYIDLQDEIFEKFYETGILTELNEIYDIEMGWYDYSIIGIMNLIVRSLDMEDLENEVIPFVKIYLNRG